MGLKKHWLLISHSVKFCPIKWEGPSPSFLFHGVFLATQNKTQILCHTHMSHLSTEDDASGVQQQRILRRRTALVFSGGREALAEPLWFVPHQVLPVFPPSALSADVLRVPAAAAGPQVPLVPRGATSAAGARRKPQKRGLWKEGSVREVWETRPAGGNHQIRRLQNEHGQTAGHH